VVPIPHLPPAVKGIYNWRGDILWIVDLSALLGIASPLPNQPTLLPIVIMGDEPKHPQNRKVSAFDSQSAQTIGAIVSEIFEIEWIDLAQIQSPLPESLSSSLSQWVCGWVEANAGEIWLVLDGKAIFELANMSADV
jgi:positive phototaxis protein PixI